MSGYTATGMEAVFSEHGVPPDPEKMSVSPAIPRILLLVYVFKNPMHCLSDVARVKRATASGIRRFLRVASSLWSAIFIAECDCVASSVNYPFEITAVSKSIGAGGFPNTTSNPFRKTSVSMFRVSYRGKRVVVHDGQEAIDEFAIARILDEAPQPALLLGLPGLYLLREDQGHVNTDILASGTGEPMRWQWLDGDSGQPSPERIATIHDASSETLRERGRLLLANNAVVLDVVSHRKYQVTLGLADQTTMGYDTSNDIAHMLSPGRSAYVLVGSRYTNDMFEYALVVVDFTAGRTSPVTFDRSALRFESPGDATPTWISHYFEWTRDPNGCERLRPRAGVSPLPWQGRLVRHGRKIEYRLYPTRQAMYDTLLSFLHASYGARDASSSIERPESSPTKTLAIRGHLLHIDFQRSESVTLLYADSGIEETSLDAYALTEEIGIRFNALLAGGQHQEMFTAFPPGG